MKEPVVTALVVTSPELRDAITALLATTSKMVRIIQADDGSAALAISLELCPQVVVLEYNISLGDVPTLLTRIKAACPESRCLVLADDAEQQWAAESARAAVTVLKGFPAAKLAQSLTGLL